ncbi:MAG: aldehyde dehydrogenase family protein [Acidobacteria bacterium]|nr:aldehyde dehydrogenase family protein [Acidobacteriota bacterium]
MADTRTDYRQLIGGEWVPGGDGTYEIINPATEQVVTEAPEASAADVAAAAAAAAEAFPAWSRTTPQERAALLAAAGAELAKRTPELIPLVISETGATSSVGSLMQIPVAISRFDRYARGALEDLSRPLPPQPIGTTPLAAGALMGGLARKVPVGVVACIAPYNFPTTSMVGKIAPALAVGCTVVMKPAPQDPLCVIELAKILDDVGFPPGVVNIVTGGRAEVGANLVADRNVDMVSFTGSSAVGAMIVAAGAPTMKRQLHELGGKGACIVMADADMDKAVGGIASVWAFHSGQICTAPTRVIVHRSRYDELVGRLAEAARALKVGDPLDAATQVGPVISGVQRSRILGHIEAGIAEGAELVVDGRDPGMDRGYYVGPTLLAGCTNAMSPVREEIFGPVVVVVPYDTDDEAIEIANDSDYGLFSYVFGGDTPAAFEVAKQVRSGRVGINSVQTHHETPFGGFKMSGIGRDGGTWGLDAYTEWQSIIWPS